jgi:GT2 family glycosyltransferase
MASIGAVVIGRNEGERLRRSLASVARENVPLVYVDSASTDCSVAVARSIGCDVVELDPSVPLSAARARNAGFERLVRREPGIEFAQFVDGDCEMVEGWLNHATSRLHSRSDVAIVCGRLRERCPEASIYNRLCDLEWNRATGEVESSGGIFMVRAEAFQGVGGFNPAIVAGEEADLCLRLREKGWKVVRLDADMAWHDAAMTRFSQWWKRSVRTGHSYAEGAWLHGRSRNSHNWSELTSILIWGMGVPLLAIGLAPWTAGKSLGLLCLYPVQVWRVRRHRIQQGDAPADAMLYAAFCVLGRFANALGLLRFAWHQGVLRRPSRIIEHKDLAPVHPLSTEALPSALGHPRRGASSPGG